MMRILDGVVTKSMSFVERLSLCVVRARDMITFNVDDIDYCTLFNSDWVCLTSPHNASLCVRFIC